MDYAIELRECPGRHAEPHRFAAAAAGTFDASGGVKHGGYAKSVPDAVAVIEVIINVEQVRVVVLTVNAQSQPLPRPPIVFSIFINIFNQPLFADLIPLC